MYEGPGWGTPSRRPNTSFPLHGCSRCSGMAAAPHLNCVLLVLLRQFQRELKVKLPPTSSIRSSCQGGCFQKLVQERQRVLAAGCFWPCWRRTCCFCQHAKAEKRQRTDIWCWISPFSSVMAVSYHLTMLWHHWHRSSWVNNASYFCPSVCSRTILQERQL